MHSPGLSLGYAVFLWFALGLCMGIPAVATKLNVFVHPRGRLGLGGCCCAGHESPQMVLSGYPLVRPKAWGTM